MLCSQELLSADFKFSLHPVDQSGICHSQDGRDTIASKSWMCEQLLLINLLWEDRLALKPYSMIVIQEKLKWKCFAYVKYIKEISLLILNRAEQVLNFLAGVGRSVKGLGKSGGPAPVPEKEFNLHSVITQKVKHLNHIAFKIFEIKVN